MSRVFVCSSRLLDPPFSDRPPLPPPQIYQYHIADIIPQLTKPPRPRGRGSRRLPTESSNFSFRPGVRVCGCFLKPFGFPFSKSSPPAQIYQYPIADIIPKLTKPPRPRGRGIRRNPTEARNFSFRPGVRDFRCFSKPFGSPFPEIPPEFSNTLYRVQFRL